VLAVRVGESEWRRVVIVIRATPPVGTLHVVGSQSAERYESHAHTTERSCYLRPPRVCKRDH